MEHAVSRYDQVLADELSEEGVAPLYTLRFDRALLDDLIMLLNRSGRIPNDQGFYRKYKWVEISTLEAAFEVMTATEPFTDA